MHHTPTPIILAASAIAFAPHLAHADAPSRPPAPFTIKSQSKKYIAKIDPKSGTTVSTTDTNKIIWKSSVTYPSESCYLANDGIHIIAYSNLIPLNYTTKTVIITFWEKDKKIREVPIGDILKDTQSLQRTVSHYKWGHIDNLDNNTVTFRRCDGKTVRFDIATGAIAATKSTPDA